MSRYIAEILELIDSRLHEAECEHHSIVTTDVERLGRCMECAQYVLIPIHGNDLGSSSYRSGSTTPTADFTK